MGGEVTQPRSCCGAVSELGADPGLLIAQQGMLAPCLCLNPPWWSGVWKGSWLLPFFPATISLRPLRTGLFLFCVVLSLLFQLDPPWGQHRLSLPAACLRHAVGISAPCVTWEGGGEALWLWWGGGWSLPLVTLLDQLSIHGYLHLLGLGLSSQ